jgi:hypothetical protein
LELAFRSRCALGYVRRPTKPSKLTLDLLEQFHRLNNPLLCPPDLDIEVSPLLLKSRQFLPGPFNGIVRWSPFSARSSPIGTSSAYEFVN